jgi:hypothetical protein
VTAKTAMEQVYIVAQCVMFYCLEWKGEQTIQSWTSSWACQIHILANAIIILCYYWEHCYIQRETGLQHYASWKRPPFGIKRFGLCDAETETCLCRQRDGHYRHIECGTIRFSGDIALVTYEQRPHSMGKQ